jgi:hypothetical protein
MVVEEKKVSLDANPPIVSDLIVIENSHPISQKGIPLCDYNSALLV